MLKKLLISGLSLSALAILALGAQTASADYYDCYGGLHSGDPRPGECYLLPRPSEQQDDSNGYNDLVPDQPSDDGNGDYGYNTLAPSGYYYDDSSTDSYPSDQSDYGYNVLEPSGYYYDDGSYDNGYDDSYNDDSGSDNEWYNPDAPPYYKKYEVRNARKYCVRDYCYILYDYCYDSTHCEEKTRRVPREHYEEVIEEEEEERPPSLPDIYEPSRNTWNYWVNYYINNYFYGYPYGTNRPECDHRHERCVYRGFHFGGFHNGYWYY